MQAPTWSCSYLRPEQAAGLAMAFKLIESAQDRWRAVNAPRLVALVRAGARVERGELVERARQDAA
jgi:hypothetical protein